MDKILTLLDVHKQAMQARDLKTFEFVTLNQTNALIPYKQAVFWEKTTQGIKLKNVSGNASLDTNGAYAQWLQNFIKHNVLSAQKTDKERAILTFSKDSIPKDQKTAWEHNAANNAACLSFKTKQHDTMAGLWLERNEDFKKPETILLNELCLLYTQTYALLKLQKKVPISFPIKSLKKHKTWATLALIALSLFPVRLTLTAPAEIIAQSPTIITVPYDGILNEINVKPGDKITANQTLFTMDTTELTGKASAAEQALFTAQKNLSRMRRESLSTPEKKTELTKLASEIAAKKIEYNHAQTLIKKSTINAPKAGIAIFTDSTDFEGQPSQTGQKIMTIADPENIELLIKAPLDNMIPIAPDSQTSFYLNVSPLNGYNADIISMGYQASIDPDGLLTYKIRASIKDISDLRIGWKGTAKIQGDWTILIYSVLRRPLITLRNITGL